MVGSGPPAHHSEAEEREESQEERGASGPGQREEREKTKVCVVQYVFVSKHTSTTHLQDRGEALLRYTGHLSSKVLMDGLCALARIIFS